MAYLIEINDIR